MPMHLFTLIGLLTIAIVAVIVIAVTAQHRRRRQVVLFASEHGLFRERKGTREFRKAWAAVLPEVPDKGSITNVIYGDIHAIGVTLFEHTHLIMAGNTIVPITHTVAAADVDPEAPEVRLVRRNVLRSLTARFKSAPRIEFDDDPELARGWLIHARDRQFARAFLDPSVRDSLSLRKPDRGWHLCGGKLALVSRGAMNAKRLDELTRRLVAVADHLDTLTTTLALASDGEPGR